MFSKLIVGVDGREGGSDAVALARTLAAPDAEIVLLHVFSSEHDYVEPLRRDALDMLAEQGDDPRFVPRTLHDLSPGRALHEQAEAEKADLIVIGSCHRGVLGRVLVGDVSRGVMHGAPCAVAIAPRGYRESPAPIRVIGVGVNHDAPAQAAAVLAGELAAEDAGELRLMTAFRPPVAFTPGYAYAYDWPRLAEEDRKASEKELHGLAQRLPVHASVLVVDGTPGEALEQLSRDVDLLVLGSRGWGAFKRVVLGSTSDRVVHHAACPVLIVPAPAEQPAEQPVAA